jgi:hypothetical protein
MAKRCIEAVRGVLFLGALVFMVSFLPAEAARAAEVVDLRVGVHPEYTRVVFELDRPAAYRIERGGGQSELVVSLDAGSIVRDVEASEALISSVTLVPTATGSKARIKLLRDGLNLKEMILANPPRIVLDVSAPKAKITPAPPAAKPVAEASPPAKAIAKAKAKPVPAPKPAKIIAAAPKATKPIIKVEAPRKPAPEPAPRAEKKEASPPARAPRDSARAAQQPPTRAPAVAPSRPLAVEPSPPSRPTELDTTTGSAKQIFALVGLVAVLMAWVVVRRRRGRVPLPSKSRLAALSDREGAEAANPFAGLEFPEDPQPAAGLDVAEPSLETNDSLAGETDSKVAGEEDDSAEPSSGFSAGQFLRREAESAVRGSTPTPPEASESRDEPRAVDPYEAGRSAGREVAEEAIALVRGLEDKINSLQDRLGEAVDSRERIERQIAAQNEELRVQRAAIARTQRAVRNIGRPDDESRGEAGGPAAD